MTYLRSRYYANSTGRFLTRDTWKGDSNLPITYNKWAYANANPILYTDPSGHDINDYCGFLPYYAAGNISKNVNLPKSNWLNTYAVAGIAVQCWATSYDGPLADSLGLAQVSNIQAETPYGDTILHHGAGLRCYLPIAYIPEEVQKYLAASCIYCFQKKQIDKIKNFNQMFVLEPVLDQTNPEVAVTLMKRRIQSVIDRCRNSICTVTDKFISAALAQNAGFTPQSAYEVSNPDALSDKNYVIPTNENRVRIDWHRYFEVRNDRLDTFTQVERFAAAIRRLKEIGWALPDNLNSTYIENLYR